MNITVAHTAASALDTLSSNLADRVIQKLERLKNEDPETMLEQSPEGYYLLREDDYVVIIDWDPEDETVRVLDVTQRENVRDAMMP